jgi:phenylalanyl-tRNA synthetase alpha chain
MQEAISEIKQASTLQILNDLRVKYLGKKGLVTQQLQGLGALSPEEKKRKGQEVNALKQSLEAAIEERRKDLEQQTLREKLIKERLDVTLPGLQYSAGGLHIMTQVINHVTNVFRSMGYEVVVGPELETDYYNFEALNIPEWHPARDLQDTFWMTNGKLLRTHCSPMQARYMETHQPPFKMVVPGKVFRNEAVDATHEAQFHQLEALVVDKRITMADLRGAITAMVKALFGDNVKTRLQPAYFQFVEPGAEFAIWWTNPVTGKSRWLELGGCGMVHPKVFEYAGYKDVTGFAFGFGLERLALIPYGIPDIRYFYQSDMRFLEQFRGVL